MSEVTQDAEITNEPESEGGHGWVDGKTYVWKTEDGDKIRIPLRIRLKVLRKIGTDRDLDAGAMFDMLELLIPDQAETLDEMDVNDFTAMFTSWQKAYSERTGAALGESLGSSN